MKFAWKTGKTVITPENRAALVQKLCLLAVIAMELAFFLVEDRAQGIAYLYAQQLLTLPAMTFLGASLCREQTRQAKRHLALGLAMICLFLLIQTAHQLLESDHTQVGPFVCAYALCLPFAAASGDGQRQQGLRWMAGTFLAIGVLLTGYAGLLLLNAVPAYLQDAVRWDGSRFVALGHPNISATILMIGIGVSAGLALESRKRWVKILLLVLLVLQFLTMALTNGRTTIVLTCLLLGGITFCALRGRSWKRFALALLAAVIVMAAAFGVSRAVYSWNRERMAQQLTEQTAGQPEQSGQTEVLVSEQYQGTMKDDLRTLNGRTEIWRTVLLGLEDNPRVKYVGTEYVEMILSRYAPCPVYHTHNSWLEALYRMGLPGLVAALVITVLALWSAGVVLWRNSDIWRSCVALLTLCLLGCALLEIYLFVVDISYFYLDFLFLMCLGYLRLWCREKAA